MKTTLFWSAAAFWRCHGQTVESPSLLPWAFPPLPVGSITPLGWLRGELQAMADGLAGHELDFYPYIKDSPWLGGRTEYSVLNEGLPYWFNGMVPLAYILDDTRLKNQVHSVASTVLDRQYADGWIGPETGADRNFWGRVPFMLGLTQLAEANATGWHDRVVQSLTRHLRLANLLLKDNGAGYISCQWKPNPLDCSWGQIRMHDLLIVIQWLLEHADLAAKDVTLLWETMDLLYGMAEWKWENWYTESQYQRVVADPRPSNSIFPYLHGVNVGQGLKASAVIRRFTRQDYLINSTWNAVEWTFKYHGAPSGTILADESQRDLATFMGSELCTAVETGYSLAYLYQALGANPFADRAELVIYNALPVMLTHDLWGHQYMDRPNGPWALNQPDRSSLFTTSNGMATVFGLEPQYPCCTVNHPQGYSKFVANSWTRAENGLVHVLLGPTFVSTSIPKVGRVAIKCETNYPFSDQLVYSIEAEGPFDLFLRFPSWAISSQSSLSLVQPGATQPVHINMTPNPETGLHRLSVPGGSSRVTFIIGSSIRVETRSRNAVSVYVGNLLYALDVGEEISSSLPHRHWDPNGEGTRDFREFDKVRDYYFNNTKPWNIAIDPTTLQYHSNDSSGFLKRGFTSAGGEGATSFLAVQGCEIRWAILEGIVTPDLPPKGERCQGAAQTYRMIPYGLAKIHMSELPKVDLSGLSDL